MGPEPTSAPIVSRLSTTSRNLRERIATRIKLLVEASPDPAQARGFLGRLERERPDAFERISSSAAALRYSIAAFAYSHFLGEAILRYPEWLLQIATSGDLHRMLQADEFAGKLPEFLGSQPDAPLSPVALARFRRRMLLRILLRDVLGMGGLAEVTEELSDLSDTILEFAYLGIRRELVARHGTPLYVDLDGEARECGFAVISLGKLGGKELNYSSDIDLMFLYTANGFTDGPEPLTNKEFFKKVANRYIELLSTYTPEGFCYRVDLRLRPDGQHGEICISLDGARQYYKTRGRDWELQMLIKARASAGDRQLARDLLDFVEPMIYSTTTDFRAVEAVSEARDRIGEKLAAKSRKPRAGRFVSPAPGRDIKLCPGGIRDIEFLVQCLQRLHGGREPWVRHGGTLFALSRLRDKELLSSAEYSRLATAYEFLRRLEHLLQVYDDGQTHTLPADKDNLEILSRKMPAARWGEAGTAASLEAALEQRLSEVQEVYQRVIYAHRPMYYSVVNPDEGAAETAQGAPPAVVPASNLTRFLDQKAPRVAAVIAHADLRRSRDRFEHFLEKAFAAPDLLATLDSRPALVESVIDIFEHSQYFSDQLIRTPELASELEPDSSAAPAFAPGGDAVQMRRSFRRAMLRVQADSILRRVPIFATLDQTSDLADGVIGEAYRLAVDETIRSAPPAGPSYAPAGQMMVIALGRLGMREFDLASDADLCFVIPDRDSAEQVFWTGVAERMIDVITSYTGDGVIFTVDTRLRPNGREGALVQTASCYKDYFAKHAEAWEGISYMKARGVAGAAESATEFLHELQEVDWRRYGQNGRSRSQLAEMRARLEREQGSRNPLKAGRGGYYDIDFALMYLRLRGAGIFYKVLNTPERIDVIEKMGHLERDDADALRESAAFYRSIDHGLRIWSGQAAGKLPASQMQLDVLTELVGRWTPAGVDGEPITAKLIQVRRRTRELFDRLFG
jgi:glutamate-ammonia-ligase adenylyltransferase